MTEIVRLHAVPNQRVMDPEPLWREVLGQRLRALRSRRGETLTETAERAGISPQYLSEIERGLKDPSSEVLAAVAGALGATLIDLTSQVTGDLRSYAFGAPQISGHQALLLAA
ncbi:helix-turn-helix domain-containing protein [Aeromicrobium ginsengisoli]|uniref:Helix-turn-helix transcriptional regulator n=1 Tax=Aeromicrobium ginsengisoli TaxID=363867 RepID=A0A5M4FCD6_9ACTN|nr:helix-turn-helix transcriptional regulator [Aeromicrobium ginsengisoli]KAA1396016.1 helix-turn-helix transcriptional regulator [Aeromicrobium ginsengisoli]